MPKQSVVLKVAPLASGLLPRRLLLAVALPGVAAAGLGPGQAAAEDARVTVQLQAGYSGTAPTDGWAPVQASVTNNGPDLRATVALTVGLGSTGYPGPGRPFAVPAFPSPGPMVPLPAIIARGPGQAPWGSPVTQNLDAVLPSGATKHLTAYLPSVPGTVRAEVLAPRR